ncbi:MAG: hypothetical protein ACRDOK_20780 [Streptosporangiaceae bacterium]
MIGRRAAGGNFIFWHDAGAIGLSWAAPSSPGRHHIRRGGQVTMAAGPASTRLARTIAVISAVAAVGFLCGWSALGIGGGAGFAVALSAGVAVPVLRSGPGECSRRR